MLNILIVSLNISISSYKIPFFCTSLNIPLLISISVVMLGIYSVFLGSFSMHLISLLRVKASFAFKIAVEEVQYDTVHRFDNVVFVCFLPTTHFFLSSRLSYLQEMARIVADRLGSYDSCPRYRSRTP